MERATPRQWRARIVTFWVAVSGADVGWAAPVVEPDELTFDTQVISGRGIDPKVADLFRQAPRFLPGETTVTLTVNGQARGRAKARFDEAGRLCADRAFQSQATIVSPPGFSDAIRCFDLKTAWPQADVVLDPGESKVDLVLPPQALRVPGADNGHWQHGGSAGLLNYTAQYMRSSGLAGGLQFGQLETEAGFNVNDWLFRSRQTLTRFDGQDNLRHQAAYAQRSFPHIQKVLQLGQISLANSLFGTGQVLGFQLFPDAALTNSQGGAGLVDGVADSPSVVEVRQSGVLVYSTTVPAGPFRLQGFSLLNTRTDLMVILTGSTGQRRQFIVPAAALLLRGATVSPGLSFGAGRLEQQGGASPLLGTLATGWALTPRITLNTGLLASAPYRAGALSVDTQPFDGTLWGIRGTLAQDADHQQQGVSLSTTLSHSLTERLSASLNASQQTSGFRELSDALQKDRQSTRYRSRNQWGAGLSWAQQTLGNLSVSWARSTTFMGEAVDYWRGGWSRQIQRAYLGVSLEHNTATRSGMADDRLYVSLSLPLGEGRDINSTFSSARQSSSTGVRYSDHTSQDRGWSLSADQDFRRDLTSVSGSIDRVTRISQLSASLSRDSDRYTSGSVRASGGMVAHANGVTLSPYRVAETFGVAQVGHESGVKLDTPSGPVWTDGRGYAVLPSLNGYQRSNVQVDTRSLAKNVDIGNAWQDTALARGAIGQVNFDVVRTRRVLVDANMPNGQPLPRGASVFGPDNQFITVVGESGEVFIPDAAPRMTLEVQNSGKTLCRLTLTLPEKPETQGWYERATARCQ